MEQRSQPQAAAIKYAYAREYTGDCVGCGRPTGKEVRFAQCLDCIRRWGASPCGKRRAKAWQAKVRESRLLGDGLAGRLDAYKKSWRANEIANERCSLGCGRGADSDHQMCKLHRDQQTHRNASSWKKLKSNPEKLAINNARRRERDRKRVAMGLCKRCPNPLHTTLLCKDCAKKDVARAVARKKRKASRTWA